MGYVLEVKNITKRFGGLVAVNNVSMGVNAGEVVGLLGDNGAGKSTLIKVISGVYRAEEGTILFMDKRSADRTPPWTRWPSVSRRSTRISPWRRISTPRRTSSWAARR